MYSFKDHLEAANTIMRNNPSNISRNVFLSLDNETLIAELHKGLWDSYNMAFYYTTFNRQNDTTSPMAMAARVPDFGLISIANLILGVHPNCAAFVEMGGSNWARLIDEIRRTDGVRCEAPYHDFAPGEWRRQRKRRRLAAPGRH